MSDTLTTPGATAAPTKPVNAPHKVLLASLIGTTIEFFDFYIYATAAVLVFPALFFPGSDPMTALLASFATFSIAFFARPFGAVVFGRGRNIFARVLRLFLLARDLGSYPEEIKVDIDPLKVLGYPLRRIGE